MPGGKAHRQEERMREGEGGVEEVEEAVALVAGLLERHGRCSSPREAAPKRVIGRTEGRVWDRERLQNIRGTG